MTMDSSLLYTYFIILNRKKKSPKVIKAKKYQPKRQNDTLKSQNSTRMTACQEIKFDEL